MSMVHQLLDDVARATPAGRLRSCRTAVPTAEHERAFANYRERARTAGLMVGTFTTKWVHGGPFISVGATSRDRRGTITVTLAVDVGQYEFAEACFRALCYVHDLAADKSFTPEELEARAERFVQLMMTGS